MTRIVFILFFGLLVLSAGCAKRAEPEPTFEETLPEPHRAFRGLVIDEGWENDFSDYRQVLEKARRGRVNVVLLPLDDGATTDTLNAAAEAVREAHQIGFHVHLMERMRGEGALPRDANWWKLVRRWTGASGWLMREHGDSFFRKLREENETAWIGISGKASTGLVDYRLGTTPVEDMVDILNGVPDDAMLPPGFEGWVVAEEELDSVPKNLPPAILPRRESIPGTEWRERPRVVLNQAGRRVEWSAPFNTEPAGWVLYWRGAGRGGIETLPAARRSLAFEPGMFVEFIAVRGIGPDGELGPAGALWVSGLID